MTEDRFQKLGGKAYELFREVFPHHDNLQDMVGLILKYYSARELIRVLDVGCGTGYTSKEIIKAGAKHIDAVDTSSVMLNKMQDWLEQKGFVDQVTLFQEFPYEKHKETYDAVVSVLTTHNLAEKERNVLIRKMCQAVAPGGLIIIGDKLGIGDSKRDAEALDYRIRNVVGGMKKLGEMELSKTWEEHYKLDELPGRKFYESKLIALLQEMGFETSTHYRLHQEAIVVGRKKP